MKKTRSQNKKHFSPALSTLAILAMLFAVPGIARAQHRGHGDIIRGFHDPDLEHGDIRVFHDPDLGWWRGGRWVHGWHGSRFGWWWVVPGGWYFYPAPVYPYPDPYVPPGVVVQPPPPSVVQAQPQAQTWYYCDSAGGYYPYVPECPSGWRAVPATPPSPPSTAGPVTPPPPPSRG
jgi:hypothetical protein